MTFMVQVLLCGSIILVLKIHVIFRVKLHVGYICFCSMYDGILYTEMLEPVVFV